MENDVNIKLEALSAVNGYENVMGFYIDCIVKSGMMLDEHDEMLRQFWVAPAIGNTPKWQFVINSMVLGSIAQYFMRSRGVYAIAAAIIAPIGGQILLTCVKQVYFDCYKRSFQDLTFTMRKLYELNKDVMQYCVRRQNSVSNLCANTKKILEPIISSEIDSFLFVTGTAIFNVVKKFHDLLQEIRGIINLGDLNFVFNAPYERSLLTGEFPQNKEAIILFEKIQLSYIMMSSDFLAGLGLSLCFTQWKSVNLQFKKIFSKIIPEAREFVVTAYEKICKSFENKCLTLLDLPPQRTDLQSPTKYRRISSQLRYFMTNLQLTFDASKAMYFELEHQEYQSTDVMENNISVLEHLLSECATSVKSLEFSVRRQIKVEQTETTQLHATQLNEASESQVDENTVDSFISHSDPDLPYDSEEYNLSIHESDDEDSYSNQISEQDIDLLDSIRTHKIMIQELNSELKKRGKITQNDGRLQIGASNLERLNFSVSLPPPLPPPLLNTYMEGLLQQNSDIPDKGAPPPPPLPLLIPVPPQCSSSSQSTLAAQIKAAANNRGINEELIFDNAFESSTSTM